MARTLPLSTALSQVIVAFTIEVDEEFESVMPHSATVKNGAGLHNGPWLVSQVMWSNYLRHIADGVPIHVVQARAFASPSTIKSRLNHLGWWGLVTVGEAKGTKYANQIVRLTAGGKRACEEFAPLPRSVEERWRARFGADAIDNLRGALARVVDDETDLPRSLPVVDYGDGMRTEVVVTGGLPDVVDDDDGLATLLARALTCLTLEVEAKTEVSLPHLANVLRLLDADPTLVKGLPLRAGVSKQGIDASITFLAKRALIAVEGKGAKATASITAEGRSARITGNRRLAAVEASWARQYGADAVQRLRAALDCVLAAGEGPDSVMAQGLVPHEGAWRAHKNYRAQTDAVLADPRGSLPHHPMVLHRGGFPDGS